MDWGHSSFAKINYYHSENDFSISLFPEDTTHEIILIMPKRAKRNFTTHIKKYKKEISLKKNQFIPFNKNDKVEVPTIAFNLEKHFTDIIGSRFLSELDSFQITEFYQRNAFILNENGAEVESEAAISVEAKELELEIQKPKKMIFNKPFVVFLKRKDADFPYFAVSIVNEKLLQVID